MSTKKIKALQFATLFLTLFLVAIPVIFCGVTLKSVDTNIKLDSYGTYIFWSDDLYVDDLIVTGNSAYFYNASLGSPTNPCKSFYLSVQNGNVTINKILNTYIEFLVDAPSGTTSILTYNYTENSPPSKVVVIINSTTYTILLSEYYRNLTEWTNAQPPAVYLDVSNRMIKVKQTHQSQVIVRIHNTPWFDSRWLVRKPLTITGSSAGAVTNYTIKVVAHYGFGEDNGNNVYLNKLCKSVFGDVRFTDENGTLLDYWLEKYSTGNYAIFWVRIPYIPAYPDKTIIYIYYGYSYATTTSHGKGTFPIFADFENGMDGFEEPTATGYTAIRYQDPDYSWKWVVEVYEEDGADYTYDRPAGLEGSIHYVLEKEPYVGFYVFVSGWRAKSDSGESTITNFAVRISAGDVPESLVEHVFVAGGTTDTGWHTETEWFNMTSNLEGYTSVWINFGFWDAWNINRHQKVFVDDIIVRKYVDPEPNITSVGIEEHQSTPPVLVDYGEFPWIPQPTVCYVNGLYWLFYRNDNGMLVFRTSYDGILWSNATIIRNVDSSLDFAIWNNATHIAYTAVSGDVIYYRIGEANSNGTISWSAPEQVVTSSVEGYPNVYVFENHPFIFYAKNGYPYVDKSSSIDGTWTSATGFPFQLNSTVTSQYWVCSFTSTPSYLVISYGDAWVEEGDVRDMFIRTYDGSGWSSPISLASITGAVPLGDAQSLVGVSDEEVHITFANITDYTIYHVIFNPSTHTVTDWLPLNVSSRFFTIYIPCNLLVYIPSNNTFVLYHATYTSDIGKSYYYNETWHINVETVIDDYYVIDYFNGIKKLGVEGKGGIVYHAEVYIRFLPIDFGGQSNNLPTVSLSSPSNGSRYNVGERVTFCWVFYDVDGDTQQQFQFQLDDSPDFSNPEINVTMYSSNEYYTMVPPSSIGVYYWRVKVYDGSEWSDWSDVRYVTVVQSVSRRASPLPPPIVEPTSEEETTPTTENQTIPETISDILNQTYHAFLNFSSTVKNIAYQFPEKLYKIIVRGEALMYAILTGIIFGTIIPSALTYIGLVLSTFTYVGLIILGFIFLVMTSDYIRELISTLITILSSISPSLKQFLDQLYPYIKPLLIIPPFIWFIIILLILLIYLFRSEK